MDSKSVGLKTVRVQVPPPAQKKALRVHDLRAFYRKRHFELFVTIFLQKIGFRAFQMERKLI